MRRSLAGGGLALLVATGCGAIPLGHAYDRRYDVVVAFCDHRITLHETCDPLESSSGDTIYAIVIFGHAGGHRVQIEAEVKSGGHGTYRSVEVTAGPGHAP